MSAAKQEPKHSRAQSSMEYLMTYGWAILIIAIAVGVLFALGLFNGSAATPNGCSPQPGFTCSNPVYTPNGITAMISQDSGQNYYDAFVFVASESENIGPGGLPVNFSESNTVNMTPIGTIPPSGTVTFNFNHTAAGGIPTANIPVGTEFTGYIWIAYCLSPVCPTPTNFAKVGTINVKEAGSGGFGGSSTPTSSSSTSSSSTSTSTTSSTTTSIGTTYNPTSGGSTSNNVVFNTSCTSPCELSNNLLTTASVTIDNGVTLNTDGFSIVAGANFINSGTIDAGLNPAAAGGAGGGSGGAGGDGSYGIYIQAQQIIGGTINAIGGTAAQCLSNCGSSGGGGSGCSGGGGDTIAAGGLPSQTCGCPNGATCNGATPSAPTNSQIAGFLLVGLSTIQNSLSGAGGGGSADRATDQNGSPGTSVSNSYGGSGASGYGSESVNAGSGGGGGGGTILLAYNSSFPAPIVSGTVTGGPDVGGGAGGNGNIVSYPWTSTPIIP